jgi:hypothetical protein
MFLQPLELLHQPQPFQPMYLLLLALVVAAVVTAVAVAVQVG